DRVRGRHYEIVLDRRSAIRLALERARPADVVLLAGKGHEQTMILADGPVPWDERAEAEQALRELGLAAGKEGTGDRGENRYSAVDHAGGRHRRCRVRTGRRPVAAHRLRPCR